MNYEKSNDHQIRFFLDKSDLINRKIDISNLTYGSDQARKLFDEISAIADSEFNFDTANSDVSIEAIPVSEDSLVVILSKEPEPDQIDTRFSKFTPTKEDIEEATGEFSDKSLKSANDILNLLSSFKDTLSSIRDESDNSTQNKEEVPDITVPSKDTKKNIYIVFKFDNMDKLIDLSHIIVSKYKGTSSVYEKDNAFYLIINNKSVDDITFNQICNISCEFGENASSSTYSVNFITEYFNPVIKRGAIKDLASI